MKSVLIGFFCAVLLIGAFGTQIVQDPVLTEIQGRVEYPNAAPLREEDFTVTLPNGIFNFAIDTRYELQEIAGKPFERYEEIPSIQLVYDRLLTNTMNFFANVGDPYLESLSFLPGSETYRGIHLGSTRAELMAAYGEPEMDFEEHGVCRIEYSCSIPINQEETILSLSFVVNVKKDAVTSILIRRGY